MIKIVEKIKLTFEGSDKLFKRLLLMSLLSVLANGLGCLMGYAIAHKLVFRLGLIGFILPVVNFSISVLFLESKTLQERLYIVIINSIALSVSAMFVALYF